MPLDPNKRELLDRLAARWKESSFLAPRIEQLRTTANAPQYGQYVNDPAGFCRSILKFQPVPNQIRALEALLKPPYRVLCPSANSTGKTRMAAAAVIWWHCTRMPAKIITTAPTGEQVKLTLWSEIRSLCDRVGLKLPFLPKACQILRNFDDFAIGTTSNSEEAFKGKHGPNQFFVFDEALGIDSRFWDAVETMFSPPGHAWLCLYNPTDPGSRAFLEQHRTTRGKKISWHVCRMSALDHPNIAAELVGQPPPVPDACRLDWFERILYANSQPIGCPLDDPGGLTLPTDICWPPINATAYCERTGQSPRWWRPGPSAETILFGRFPRQGQNSVWSDGDWISAIREGMPPLQERLVVPQIGCDVATTGADQTAIHVRSGCCSLHHEEVNGQLEPQTVGRLKELAEEYANWYNRNLADLPPAIRCRYDMVTKHDIRICVDNDGLGGSISSFLLEDGFAAQRIGAGSKAIDEKNYPNRRSELWFVTAERARTGELDFTRLSEEVIDQARKQAMSATWSLDSRARRVVMPKDEMRKKMGRSPDTMDAINLAYCEVPEELYGDAIPVIAGRRRDPLGPSRSIQERGSSLPRLQLPYRHRR